MANGTIKVPALYCGCKRVGTTRSFAFCLRAKISNHLRELASFTTQHTFFADKYNRYVSRRPNDTPPHSHMLASSSMSGTTTSTSGGSSGTANRARLVCAHLSCAGNAAELRWGVVVSTGATLASLIEALECSKRTNASDGRSFKI